MEPRDKITGGNSVARSTATPPKLTPPARQSNPAGARVPDLKDVSSVATPHGPAPRAAMKHDIMSYPPPPVLSLTDRVRQVVAMSLDLQLSDVKANSRLVEDLGADSLDPVDVAIALELAFDVKIPDGAAEKMLTVKDAIDFIQGASK